MDHQVITGLEEPVEKARLNAVPRGLSLAIIHGRFDGFFQFSNAEPA